MSQPNKILTDDDVVEYILQVLLRNLDKNEMHIEHEILAPAKLQLNESQLEHIREIMMATNLVRASVGFGKNGYFYLSNQGIQVLKTYGSYRNYIAATHGLVQQSTPETNTATPPSPTSSQSAEPPIGYNDMAH